MAQPSRKNPIARRAHEVFADSGTDVFVIGLEGVISKYTGETEKNLRRVLDGAKRKGAVLLIDEADALFGKRSKVKDAHDRYSNVEVSYLLSRIAEAQVPVLLGFNLGKKRRVHLSPDREKGT